jgi:hypothetical protein
MGGGKSTTLLIAKYFCHLANALVITISGQIRAKTQIDGTALLCQFVDLFFFIDALARVFVYALQGATSLTVPARCRLKSRLGLPSCEPLPQASCSTCRTQPRRVPHPWPT